MAEPTSRRWTARELVAVISLYCQLPFGQMHSKHPAVIAAAQRLDRTPSAMALKLVNFASLDPYHQSRNVSGMRNVSRLDREVWDACYGNWEELGAAMNLDDLVAKSPSPARNPQGYPAPSPAETEAQTIQTVRRGQSFFRHAVLASYDLKCCVTGITCQPLLRASHIMPWAASSNDRLNPANGLCLNSLHDAAFDRGLFTLSDDCEIILSKRLANEMPKQVFDDWFGRYDNQPIRLPDRFRPHRPFIEYHRDNIFAA